MMRLLLASLVLCAATAAQSEPRVTGESDSTLCTQIFGAGGAVASIPALLNALPVAPVIHNSGTLILTGGSGYVGGTLGIPAAAFAALTSPMAIASGVVIGASAGAVYLYCRRATSAGAR
jgi:hypothetical protein